MSSNEPLLPDDWSELSPMVDRLLDTPPSERPALLDELAGNDPARRAALERLVAECERELGLLDRPAIEQFPQLLQEDAGPPLPELLGGHYRIERELGRGGMARVYLAHDVRHARLVAVKVIRHEIASSLGRDRFLREIGIAARLRHPNIMPLYDSGDVDGLLYFVMPYEEGKSLRARLDASPRLGVAEGVSILRDVARALAYAHEQGVVHRDVKPDNVMLSGDAAVVTDFGIAKALTAAATETGIANATQAGTVIGTPAYMSPEQAVGDPATDHRADIYAFGCLAYELFAGVAPFTGATTHDVISAKLSAPLKPLTDHRPDTPAAVARLIARCLEKDPAARPSSATQLLEVLGTMTATTESTTRKRRRFSPLAAAVLALGIVILGVWYAATRGGQVTVAVLPLQVTGDSANAIAEGFTEDLGTALWRVPWLRVMSRGGANNYRGQADIDWRAVCDALGVRYYLMGSLRQDGAGVSVTVSLLDCEDGSNAWAEKFAQPMHLAFVRDSIATAVGNRLREDAGRFAKRFATNTPARRPVDREAYADYLLGKRKLSQRGSSVGESIALFRRALARDSMSADAWSGLSLALAISPAFQGAWIDSVAPSAKVSAERAMRLDSSLSEPHIALAVVHGLNWEWDLAEAELKKALVLNSHDVEARIQYARLLQTRGRLPEAFQQLDLALSDDAASSLVRSFKGSNYLHRGQIDSAIAWSDKAMESDSSNRLTRIFRSMILVAMKDSGVVARKMVENVYPFEPTSLYVTGASGDAATVNKRLNRLATTDSGIATVETARAYAYLGIGDTASALGALERATARREIWPTISPPSSPIFKAVRTSPRFRAILESVHLVAR